MPVVIVAIPSEDDYVWKISSEKVPHMTMINLGEDVDQAIQDRIAKFLEHLASTSLYRFGLGVDYRGTLGPKDADVLFFRKDDCAEQQVYRALNFMLNEPEINLAYNLTDQFEEWTPHLTLGYPESPAKEDKREYPVLGWVNFDKIALWNGDYTGPEFRLMTWQYPSLAYSDTTGSPMTQIVGQDKPSLEELMHHGVKGQKWGVIRKNLSDVADAKSASKQALNERVASGTNTKREYAKVALGSPVTRLATRGVRGTAKKNAEEWQQHRDRVSKGEATVSDILVKYGQLTYGDLGKALLRGTKV